MLDGLKGDAVAGVDNALRFVDIESSITDLDARRKDRTAVWEKQNCGVSAGGGGG